ncbi:hypothetical protein DSM07_00540 [Oenococcus sp. UCMA 16435]|nr:hypothetical protein DSM07_00540 [Oenococcus sp. UCMA 16435]
MNKHNYLLYRNALLYWGKIKYRFYIISLIFGIVIFINRLRGNEFKTIFNGVHQVSGTFTFPSTWLFLVFAPLLIIGESISQLVKKNYLSVNTVSLKCYLLTLIELIIATELFLCLLAIVLSGKSSACQFMISFFIYSSIVACTYALLEIFLTPAITQIFFLGIFVAAISINNFPIISHLMFCRSPYLIDLSDIAPLGLLIIGITGLIKFLYHIDFTS